MTEFNLSEKIVDLGNDTWIKSDYVKLFIRWLKKYFTSKQSRIFIDKLAGDDLK